jgi:hypothetical protein
MDDLNVSHLLREVAKIASISLREIRSWRNSAGKLMYKKTRPEYTTSLKEEDDLNESP